MSKKPLIVLTGPTAVGKTKASICLAKRINGEIISADSMQVYKHMDIGSAKITKEEMQGVPHHLIDILDPREPFHIVKFQDLAREAMNDIYNRGHVPILVGGTGFYIQSILYDIDFTSNDQDTSYRKELEEIANLQGPLKLHEMLQEVDPESAESIHYNNVKRVIRALEYYKQTGEKISSHNEQERQKVSPYNSFYFVLNDDRANLYDRIDQRVDEMFRQGLVDEVKTLKAMGLTKDYVSMQGLGYKEVLDYLDGLCTLEDAIYTVKRDTRHFAKRQITWFKREKEVIWVNKQDFNYNEDQILDFIVSKLNL